MKIIRALFGAMIMMSLCSCGIIDFREKALATETKVIGFDAEIPGAFNSGASLAILRLGYISHKYISAPDGGKATINDEYKDISIWKLAGSGESNLSAENTMNLSSSCHEPATTNHELK